MYKKILVPLDGSSRAERILPHVEELAHNFDSQVIFLQVVEPQYVINPVHGYSSVDFNEKTIKAITEQADSYIDGLIGNFREKNIKAKSYVKRGSIAHTIMEVAEQEDIDLIAMASHGRSGLSRVFYGSVAASVLHIVDRPILIIRAQGNE